MKAITPVRSLRRVAIRTISDERKRNFIKRQRVSAIRVGKHVHRKSYEHYPCCCPITSDFGKRNACHAGEPGYGEPRLERLAILERLTRFRFRAW